MRDMISTFTPDLPEQCFNVLTTLVDEPVSFLEANTFDAFQIVTAWKNASDKKHVQRERAEIQFFNKVEFVYVYFDSYSIFVHLKEALRHSKRK